MTKARILIADDHPLFREGLRQILSTQPDVTICGEAGRGSALFQAVGDLNPDVVLMDLVLGPSDGLATIKNLLSPWPELKILVLTAQSEAQYAARCWRAGACGFVSKLEPPTQVLSALRSVIHGRLHFSAEVVTHARTNKPLLSDREIQVLRLIGDGQKCSGIAAALGISTRTVDTHRENLKRKLGVQTSALLSSIAAEFIR